MLIIDDRRRPVVRDDTVVPLVPAVAVGVGEAAASQKGLDPVVVFFHRVRGWFERERFALLPCADDFADHCVEIARLCFDHEDDGVVPWAGLVG